MVDSIMISLGYMASGFLLVLFSMFIFLLAGFLFTNELAQSLYFIGYCIFTIMTTVGAIGSWNTDGIYIWLGFTIPFIIFLYIKKSCSS